ncbi:unnamed protein product, partial [Discosporangium mesarthrocarpum]
MADPTGTGTATGEKMTQEQAARLLLSHTLETPEGGLFFLPTAADPFSSGFKDGKRLTTAWKSLVDRGGSGSGHNTVAPAVGGNTTRDGDSDGGSGRIGAR